MFRKIHSNRDPANTLFTSLGKEFSVYFDAARIKVMAFLKAYPKLVFGFMVAAILASLVLTFFVLKTTKPKLPVLVKSGITPVENGLGRILSTADALRESLQIKREVSALIEKDSLSAADSAKLEKALDRFHQLTITKDPHEPH